GRSCFGYQNDVVSETSPTERPRARISSMTKLAAGFATSRLGSSRDGRSGGMSIPSREESSLQYSSSLAGRSEYFSHISSPMRLAFPREIPRRSAMPSPGVRSKDSHGSLV